MAVQSGIDQDALIACIHQHRPDSSVSLEPIRTGKFNDSFFVRADDEELVLRVAPPRDAVFVFYERDMMRQEPGIHALLSSKTSVPVARIVVYDDSLSLLPRDYLLMERLPGRALSDAGPVDATGVLRSVGACLAEVHGLRAETYGYIGEHRPMEPQTTWVGAFQIMWRKLVYDVVATGHYTQSEADALLALLDRHLPLFDRPVPSCLLHMDIVRRVF